MEYWMLAAALCPWRNSVLFRSAAIVVLQQSVFLKPFNAASVLPDFSQQQEAFVLAIGHDATTIGRPTLKMQNTSARSTGMTLYVEIFAILNIKHTNEAFNSRNNSYTQKIAYWQPNTKT